jgi:hypothetical protein
MAVFKSDRRRGVVVGRAPLFCEARDGPVAARRSPEQRVLEVERPIFALGARSPRGRPARRLSWRRRSRWPPTPWLEGSP